MIYNEFKGERLSALGFGTMRLPVLEDGKTIDVEQTRRMVDYAIAHGINYFDTAVPYHDGKSESVIGEILSEYPREMCNLATKYPGHQHSKVFDPAATFAKQLEKCRVDHFDYYLFHNITENSLEDYMDSRWGMLEYFVEQRRLGRIRHLGMSSHASVETLRSILDGPYGREIEFCQIQLNYLDWTLQDAAAKVKMLNERGIPVWVMEPVRGGRLARIPGVLVSSAFRWVQSIPGVTMTLSGMSDMKQMMENVSIYDNMAPVTEKENAELLELAETLKKGVPCTACRYCCDGCPAGLDIPALLNAYNDLSIDFAFTPMMFIESLPEEKRPSSCLACGACSRICPQGIDIPGALAGLKELYDRYPKWSDICIERNKLL